jgi:F-type H+-transporting ATPase subunit a
VLVILAPIEVLGLVTRHAVLAVRLFANMFAGDMVLLTMIGFIFLFESYAIAPFSLLGAVAVGLLEVLIDVIQAYVFTLLSAVFIGISVQQE